MLNTETGTVVHGPVELNYGYDFTVKSQGFIMRDDGIIYMALNNLADHASDFSEQEFRIMAIDSLTNTVYHNRKSTSESKGVSASLVQGSGSYNYLYAGGNI